MKDPVLGDTATGKRVRRRRSWYRRRLRRQRTLIAVVVGTVFAAACWQNVSSYLSSPSAFGAQALPGSLSTQANLRKNHGLVKTESPRLARLLVRIPGVYPYSVVPGGVKNSNDLRMAAQRDAAVRRHYSHFDFSNARLIRNTEAREVYLSYRIRDTVFWTKKKVRLLPGELLLTDGKITARAHCGNQISDTAKPEVSDEEPSEDVLDQPVAIEPTAAFPARPALAPADLPTAAPTPPQLFGGGGFVFPYVSFAGPYPASNCPAGEIDTNKHCHKHKPPISPEPSTMILLGSGLALIFWRYRRTRLATA